MMECNLGFWQDRHKSVDRCQKASGSQRAINGEANTSYFVLFVIGDLP